MGDNKHFFFEKLFLLQIHAYTFLSSSLVPPPPSSPPLPSLTSDINLTIPFFNHFYLNKLQFNLTVIKFHPLPPPPLLQLLNLSFFFFFLLFSFGLPSVILFNCFQSIFQFIVVNHSKRLNNRN